MLMRIAAAREAGKMREVRARLPSPAHLIVRDACARFNAQAAFGEEADPLGFVVLHSPKGGVAELAEWLLAQGAERVSVGALEHVFSAQNALYEELEAAIGA
jgi:ATP phosphoribosyltransferase